MRIFTYHYKTKALTVMRKVITKCTAIRAVIITFALLAIISIYPLRIWTSTLNTSSGAPVVGEADPVNYENDLMQEFVTRYDRLSAVRVYVAGVERGQYLACIVYDENGAIALTTYVDTKDLTIPGYVEIPLELNVEVDKHYALKFNACRSKYTLAVEDAAADTQYYGALTSNYQPVEGYHLAAEYIYRLPMSKSRSLLMIGIIAAVTAAIYAGLGLFYKKNPDRNSVLTVGKTIKVAANPVAALVFGALMIMVFPLKMFDWRANDIIFYELGLIIAAAIVFYAINHKVIKHDVGISFWQSLRNENRVQYILIMFSIAMAIWYGCRYMNDLYDIYHSMSERLMIIWLLIAMILTFTLKEAFQIYNLIWLIFSTIYGVHYYSIHKLTPEDKEFDLKNAILRYGVIITILAGILILNIIRNLILILQKKYHKAGAHGEKPVYRITPFGIILVVFLITLVILRNTRLWGIYLAATFICFYLRYAAWGNKKDYYKILSGGLMMNFAISLIYSWAHRYFAGYTSGRFAFIFHTVTVTAEYFTFMGAAAAVMLIVKIVALPKKSSAKEIFVSAWKEITLFGFIMSYAIFTVSRTAYLAIIISMLLVIAITIAYHKKQFLRIVAVFAAAVILCFPASFTLQRILPAIAADPMIYPIDDTDEFIRGGAAWNSTNFMCIERFGSLFAGKILGIETDDYEYPIDRDNYTNNGTGDPIYDIYGFPFEGSEEYKQKYGDDARGLAPATDTELAATHPIPSVTPYPDLLASQSFTRAEFIMLLNEMNGYVDYDNKLDVISNGRITIFRSYLANLNLFGHDEMGVLLPNGEIAVHAHNVYIQVAHDHGIVGGLLFIIMLVTALVSSIKLYKNNRNTEPLSLMVFAIIVGFMVAGISEWVFQFSNPMTIALMLAFAPMTCREVTK
jgi:hypothetical protein